MSQIASKNLYELLGNDPELDPDRPADPPTKVIDKPVARTGKRNAAPEGPARDAARPATTRGGRQDGAPVNARPDQRDDGLRADRHANRTRGDREGDRGRGHARGRGAIRSSRGGAGRTVKDARQDRQSHTGIAEHEKQAEKGWGGQDGQSEWNDEKAGEAIATEEAKDEAEIANGEAAEPEPEDKTKSYDQYLAEQAEKRLALGSSLATRKANEGSKAKFPQGTELRNEEQDFFAGSGGKKLREKDVKQKDLLVLDGQYYAAPDSNERGGRGGRGGGRGGRGRGDSRGERGGRGRGRGEFRGGAPRGDRENAGGRGGAGARGGFNATDASAFPALGA